MLNRAKREGRTYNDTADLLPSLSGQLEEFYGACATERDLSVIQRMVAQPDILEGVDKTGARDVAACLLEDRCQDEG